MVINEAMNQKVYDKLRHIHRVNRVLWTSVLSGMILLFIITFIFKYNGYISAVTLSANPQLENMMLLFTIGLLFLIFYLKRHYLVPRKLIDRAEKKEISYGTGDIADFKEEFGEDVSIIAKALILMRRYFMLVWSLANIVLLFGFIAFILAGQFQTFLIYVVVSLYSMFINFPSFALIEKCVAIVDEKY